MHAIDSSKLRHLVTEIYQRVGVKKDSAALLADTLVMADLWGHSSHGVLRTSWYAERIENQVIQLDAEIEILRDTGPLVALDGHNGMGQVITKQAATMASQRARQFGIACISIRRSGHFGTAMYFTKMLADQDMIGFLTTNASPAMPPFGGRDKMVGNNPESWAAPTHLPAPFIIDIAHTAVARGKIYLAKDKGVSIPDNWALAQDGQPTTDPAQAISGSLLPMAGHKGFGLSAMMDILSGILSAGHFGTAINGPYSADKPSGVGHFLLALDISKLRDVADFKADMEAMITSWKNSPKAEGVDEIFYPGELEYRHYKNALQNGLLLPEDTLSHLLAFAQARDIKTQLSDIAFQNQA